MHLIYAVNLVPLYNMSIVFPHTNANFFISNLVAKAPGLNFGKKLTNMLSKREALN